MQLKFEGLVRLGDERRVTYSCDVRDHDYGCECASGAVFIGDADIIKVIDGATWGGKVTVGLGDERFDGALFVEEGYGYSEYTPVASDKLTVGSHDIISMLERHEGKHVTLWVSDEPVDLLAGV